MSDHPRRYLIDERPLTIQPTLIKIFGFEQATILQQFHWLLGQPRTGTEHDGQKWIWGTYEEWCEDYFTFWEPRTLRYHVNKLTKSGVLIAKQLRKDTWDRTNYYTIDYQKLDASIGQHVDASIGQQDDGSSGQDHDASIGQQDDGSYIGTEKTTDKSSEKTTEGKGHNGTEPPTSPQPTNPPPLKNGEYLPGLTDPRNKGRQQRATVAERFIEAKDLGCTEKEYREIVDAVLLGCGQKALVEAGDDASLHHAQEVALTLMRMSERFRSVAGIEGIFESWKTDDWRGKRGERPSSKLLLEHASAMADGALKTADAPAPMSFNEWLLEKYTSTAPWLVHDNLSKPQLQEVWRHEQSIRAH